MKQDLLNDIKTSKSVKIIGVSAIASSENRASLEEVLFTGIDSGNKICIVIAESDNQLFQQSLITDVATAPQRISFEELTTQKKFFFNEFTINEKRQKSVMRISSLTLPFFAIQADEKLWYLPINDLNYENYFQVKKDENLYLSMKKHIELLTKGFEEGSGIPENEFLAKPDSEILELFDQNMVPRGIFPRDCFYGTDHYQYVVWGLIFNREGRLLIHKRKENAKDNQGMWDKSVGGHIDFEKEKSAQEAIVRELIEELFSQEQVRQEGHTFSMLTDDISKVYFLGDWRLEENGPYYLNHVKLIERNAKHGEENWVLYRYPLSFTHNTPRLLPDGNERWLRVMVEVYIVIANTAVTDASIGKFKNSEFLLIDPNRLKSWIEKGENADGKEFKITPDLKYIMTGKLRDIISEVSTTIKFSGIRKVTK